MEYTTNQKIQECLRGYYSDSTKNATLNDLLKWWKNVASRSIKEDDIDEYLNDLFGTREIIEKIINFIESNEKTQFIKELEFIDDRFRLNTVEVENPFWVENNEFRKKYWFYYRAPKYLVESENLKLKEVQNQ